MEGVEALLFDVFGTVVDWHGSVTNELKAEGDKLLPQAGGPIDWAAFAMEWRQGYYNTTQRVAEGGSGPSSVDAMHREILESMLASPKWAQIASIWNEKQKDDLVLVWHRLNGWPDTTEGLYALKKQKIIATLSNGNVRLLLDMAKHADLPWDTIFSAELFGSYKPNSKVYLGGAHHLSIPPEKCAMVAAHIYDLRGAAANGMKTIYVRRPTEDNGLRDTVKSKKDGGEVDIVVDSFVELANILGKTQ